MTRSSIVAAIVFLAGVQSGQDPTIAAEVARVRSQINASVPEGQRASLVQRLDRADAALKAGRTYQALYLLEASDEGASAFAFAASSGVQSPDDFLKTWTRLGAPKPRSGKPGRVPAVLDAIAEAAEDRGLSTYPRAGPTRRMPEPLPASTTSANRERSWTMRCSSGRVRCLTRDAARRFVRSRRNCRRSIAR